MTESPREDAAGNQSARDEYEMSMLLERLESLVEEMDEVGIADRAAAEAFPAIREDMDDLAIGTRAEALARIVALSAQLDAAF